MSIIAINSLDRINPLETSSRFSVRVQPAMTDPSYARLLYATIPNSTYNITSSNNVLSFDDGSVVSITIQPGSYNTASLASTIAAAMTAAGSQTYTVTYNPITYHYTISAPGAFNLLYEFFANNTIFPTLGYRFRANSAAATSHEGNSAVQLWRTSYFLIRIDKVPYKVQTTKATNNFGSFIINNTTSQDGTVLEWRERDQYEQKVHISVNVDVLYIELIDERGNLADINNSEWSFALCFR